MADRPGASLGLADNYWEMGNLTTSARPRYGFLTDVTEDTDSFVLSSGSAEVTTFNPLCTYAE
jgi:hypothetical protein